MNRSPSRPPSLAWAIVLGVLPVVALSVVAAVGWMRDRDAVEDEARARARRIVEAAAPAVGRDVASGLKHRAPLAWHWTDAGDLVDPSPVVVPAGTAPWTRALTPPAREAFERLRSLEATGADATAINAAITAFEATDPGPEARANIVFARARVASSATNAGAASRWLKVAEEAGREGWTSESGAPLDVLAFLAACRAGMSAADAPAGEDVLQGVVRRRRPSLLATEALRAARGEVALDTKVVEAASAEWERAGRARTLAPRVAAWVGRAAVPSASWLDLDGSPFLVVARVPAAKSLSPGVAAGAFPAAAVADLGRTALAGSTLLAALPDGVVARVEIAGRDVGPGARAGPELARAEAPGAFPPVAVVAMLADPDALFASQRRRLAWLGATVSLAVAASALGGWQAIRAFRRQAALNEERSNFVSSVSHELRAPLASVQLLAEGLAEGRPGDDAGRRGHAALIVREARRLGALVANVLDFARIEQGRKSYERAPTDLSRLVAETVPLPAAAAAERGVRLVASVPDGPAVEAMADGAALQQALLNLVDNALKHAPEGSEVTVTLAVHGAGPARTVRLSVSDHGPGIPPEDRERVFERFFRRGSELRRETQGVGLGLALVRHVAAGHGGRAWAGETPGGGATVSVEFPAEATR